MIPTKAVITAANPDEKHLPLQTITDSNGETKSALQIILDDLFSAGLEAVAIVIAPASREAYAAAVGPYGKQVTFIEQSEPRGYGHAVWCAREFTAGEPFVLLVGDHLYLSHSSDSCVKQLLAVAAKQDCQISSVQATHESKLHLYGTVGASRVPGSDTLFTVHSIMEKPTPTLAEQDLIIPGLRHGNYLCFFGVHVLAPKVMELLDAGVSALSRGDTLGLTPTLATIAGSEKFLATQINGTRFNLGERYGLLRAQVALALAGPHRDEVLTSLVEILATSK
jgi:UTP--glucose-1-phosphate uridylyltransferase